MNRLEFYIGDIVKPEGSSMTINELKKGVYDSALKKILIRTGHQHKHFYFVSGDVEHVTSFALCKNRCADSNTGVILRCLEYDRHWYNYYNRPADIPFDKKLNAVFWRGVTTGRPDRAGNRFDLVKRWYGKYDIAFSKIVQGRDDYKKYVKEERPITYFLKHKYIISVEGNDKDSGLNWKLNSNSLVLMARPRVTSWLMETTLIPDYHYVLLKDDFSDLEERLRWCKYNQEKCKEIISNANNFMKQFADVVAEEKLEVDVINNYIHNLNLLL